MEAIPEWLVTACLNEGAGGRVAVGAGVSMGGKAVAVGVGTGGDRVAVGAGVSVGGKAVTIRVGVAEGRVA